MTVVIYHNAGCSNSRGALEIIRAQGIVPEIREYLTSPLTKAELAALIERMALRPRDIVREKEAVFAQLGLTDASDDALLDAMAAHPVLMNRPIVVTPKGARLCRPPELVKELL